MTLYDKLLQALKDEKEINLNGLSYLCDRWNCKVVTADRELRRMRSPEDPHYISTLKVLTSSNGAIIGYYLERD